MYENLRTLNMKQYKEKIDFLVNSKLKAIEEGDVDYNVPIFVWGYPGIGKSKIIASYCKDTWPKQTHYYSRPWDLTQWAFYNQEMRNQLIEIGLKNNSKVLMDVRLTLDDSTDLKGFPRYDEKAQRGMHVRFNSILPDPNFPLPIILLLDELPQACELVQSAAYSLINDRQVGDYILPPKCITMAAGNPAECGGVFNEPPPALKSRFDQIYVDIDIPGFLDYMQKQKYDQRILDFLKYSNMEVGEKEVIYNFSPDKEIFPTFRSWEKVCKKIKYNDNVLNAIIDSCGQFCAAKYEVYSNVSNLIPNAEELVKGKMYFDDEVKQIIACQKVINNINVLANEKNKNLLKLWKNFEYFYYMEKPKDVKNKRDEISVMFIFEIVNNEKLFDTMAESFKKAYKEKEVDPIIYEEKIEKNKIKDFYMLLFYKWKIIDALSSSKDEK